ncbi:MAG: acyl-ACP--UDP-N-acetylglucosamine O-acyltransferase [Pseudomonadota bacterium]
MSPHLGAEIHPTAIVAPGAEIGAGCSIGPYVIVGGDVVLGEKVVIHSHAVVTGHTDVGAGTRIFPFASIGHEPQDLKFAGEETRLVIGARNTIREYVTMNPGTAGGGGITRVGDGNLFMMSVHVGHDCQVGSGVIIANSVALAGHVVVEDNVVIGGLSGIQQFCRIGRGAMIGGMSGVVADVIPYGTTAGERAHLAGLNLIGLKRRGADRDEVNELRAAYSDIFEDASLVFQDRIGRARERYPENALIHDIVRFVQTEGAKRFTQPE